MRIIKTCINANLFLVKQLEIGSSPFSILKYAPPPHTGPSFPLVYVVSIYHISIQYKGFAGSRGGGGGGILLY